MSNHTLSKIYITYEMESFVQQLETISILIANSSISSLEKQKILLTINRVKYYLTLESKRRLRNQFEDAYPEERRTRGM
jgi:hypothetical protein